MKGGIGIDPRSRSTERSVAGFTLVEILVVIAILAIAAGTVALSVDRDERGMTVREARRFAGALEYAAARAQMRSETLGVSASLSGWHFWIRDEQGAFAPLAGDDALAPHAMEAPLSLRALAYAGRSLPADAIVPLRASGRNDPFAFAVETPRWRVVLASDPLNRIAVAAPAPLPP